LIFEEETTIELEFFFKKRGAHTRIYSFTTHSMRITSARKHAQSSLPL
jgi:hypothetical protein